MPLQGFPSGLVVKNPTCNAGDVWSLVPEDPTGLGAIKPMHHTY